MNRPDEFLPPGNPIERARAHSLPPVPNLADDMAAKTMQLAGTAIPIVLPNRRDARLHTAAVILSIHLIGITALGFAVSVPQIVSAILAAALIDVVLAFRLSRSLVWPASGMLTGSGVALILRLTGMQAGSYWSWEGWYVFAGVAAASILSKYLIRWRGNHIFNPSNIGLVIAFLILGADVVEPLDFWWAPFGLWMMVAYVLIIGGGILITRRLNLLEMAVIYWGFFAAGLGVLAASGHCITTSWSTAPVCGERFWTVLVTSPEVLVFLFFMITDPKTIPTGRAARVAFAATLALGTVLLIAPASVEFWAKVGLLSSLAIWSPIRGLFDRLLPAGAPDRAGSTDIARRLSSRGPAPAFGLGAIIGALVGLGALAIIAAGGPSRPVSATTKAPPGIEIEVDPSTLPQVVIESTVQRLDLAVDDRFARQLALTLAENLAIEAEATRIADSELLRSADDGNRLAEMQARIDTGITAGTNFADHFAFETLSLTVDDDVTGQSGAALAFDGEGTVATTYYDSNGDELSSSTQSFRSRFALRQVTDERWLIVAVRPED